MTDKKKYTQLKEKTCKFQHVTMIEFSISRNRVISSIKWKIIIASILAIFIGYGHLLSLIWIGIVLLSILQLIQIDDATINDAIKDK